MLGKQKHFFFGFDDPKKLVSYHKRSDTYERNFYTL